MSRPSKLLSKSLALLKEIEKAEKQEKALYAKRCKLQSTFDKGLGKVILATGALANYNWYASTTKFWLGSRLEDVRDSKLVEFKELMYNEYHGLSASFCDDKASLRIHDSNVDLNFHDGETMAKFIIDNKLIVNTERIDEVVSKLQADLEGYLEAQRYAKVTRVDND